MLEALLIDLSGTVHIEKEPIQGVREALALLRERLPHIKLKFLSNTTKTSTHKLYLQLRDDVGLGDLITPDMIMTSLSATRIFIDQNALKPLLMVDPEASEEFTGLLDLPVDECDCVVVGLSPRHFVYDGLNDAFRLLINSSAHTPLIAMHQGRYFQRHDGPCLGPGPFVKALEYASDRQAHVIGKPTRSFFEMAMRSLGITDPNQCAMVGDDVRDDVGGALAMGMQAYLVQTGKYRPGDETRYPDITPTRTFTCLPKLIHELVKVETAKIY